jgi:hypothetical protein
VLDIPGVMNGNGHSRSQNFGVRATGAAARFRCFWPFG